MWSGLKFDAIQIALVYPGDVECHFNSAINLNQLELFDKKD